MSGRGLGQKQGRMRKGGLYTARFVGHAEVTRVAWQCIHTARWSKNSTTIATASYQKQISLVSVDPSSLSKSNFDGRGSEGLASGFGASAIPSTPTVNVLSTEHINLPFIPSSIAWQLHQERLLVGGARGLVSLYDAATGQSVWSIKAHTASVSSVAPLGPQDTVCSASFDGTVAFSDTRTAAGGLIMSKRLGSAAISCDVDPGASVCVAATRDEGVAWWDLRSPGYPFTTRETKLNYVPHVVRCMPDGEGCIIGGAEGRCEVAYKEGNNGYAYKCHRNGKDTWAVNDISFRVDGAFLTAGSDGKLNVWDHESRKRLQDWPSQMPDLTHIVSADFSTLIPSIVVVAEAYDFSNGTAGYDEDNDSSTIHIMCMSDH
eukprot:TRINITY_DN3138_c0_g1_i3.p1 TRINITY_DN3138_c0_g1~~TRINITY_DN3138_c0_g1_i3.p1  ORF type:complete len:375 (+),score=76.91 TRINITY_DN3138_c0_g1_i3:133-1257(+)